MKTILMTGATVIALAMAGGSQAQADALMKANGCMNCHAVDTKKVGPSFKDIAAKNKGKADAEAALVAQLKAGKGHPAIKASDADIGTMVKFVLAQYHSQQDRVAGPAGRATRPSSSSEAQR